ncbi:hypothetical protein V3C99_009932 [Haemonchus contortus]
MADLFSEIFPEDDSDTEKDEAVEEKLFVNDSTVPEPSIVNVKDEGQQPMETDSAPPVLPAVIKERLIPFKSEDDFVWKPDVIKDVQKDPPKRKGNVLDAMGRERYLLMKDGQEELANLLYRKREVIMEHVENAEEIVFDDEKRLDTVRAFIEERFRMRYGPNADGSVRRLSKEDEDEQQFLIDNSLFITRVILRMNNLEPDNYKSEFANFHAMAKSKIVFEQTEIRDKELVAMKRRLDMARRQAREDRLERIRCGEESSDDDLLLEEDDDARTVELSTEYEHQLISRLEKLQIRLSADQLADMIKEKLVLFNIRSTQSSRERMPSPPRLAAEDLSGDVQAIDLPWLTNDDGGDDEVLEEDLPLENNEKPRVVVDQNIFVYNWSETLFPDEEAKTVGEKRPLDVAQEIGSIPKRRAVEKDGERKRMDTIPPPPKLKSCMRPQEKILTDIDQNTLSVKERIKWREQLEYRSVQKKKVRFRDFKDPENKCRFYVRPTDSEVCSRELATMQNQLRDACRNALYADCPLFRGQEIIRRIMSRYVPPAASNFHNQEVYLERLAKEVDGASKMATYKLLHPANFLRTDIREAKVANGVHLPAVPGKRLLHVLDMTTERRAYMLSRFRANMHSFCENRAGISNVRHTDPPMMVSGILILSDTLLQVVAPEKLTNVVLECFEPTQGVEDMITILDRCSYEELNIRHCVLAWGHDLITYLKHSAIDATGKAIAALIHLRVTFEQKRAAHEQEGYRRRKLPEFWILTIPEIGEYMQHFKIFNSIIRALFMNHEYYRVLDWAAEVDLSKSTEKRKSPYTKVAVENRLVQLFDLCRQKLDLSYYRYRNQIIKERKISYEKPDYDEG